ncbi:MAG: hypothetical protein ACTSRZ_13135, partial [Promethearchaeota archaeon]
IIPSYNLEQVFIGIIFLGIFIIIFVNLKDSLNIKSISNKFNFKKRKRNLNKKITKRILKSKKAKIAKVKNNGISNDNNTKTINEYSNSKTNLNSQNTKIPIIGQKPTPHEDHKSAFSNGNFNNVRDRAKYRAIKSNIRNSIVVGIAFGCYLEWILAFTAEDISNSFFDWTIFIFTRSSTIEIIRVLLQIFLPVCSIIITRKIIQSIMKKQAIKIAFNNTYKMAFDNIANEQIEIATTKMKPINNTSNNTTANEINDRISPIAELNHAWNKIRILLQIIYVLSSILILILEILFINTISHDLNPFFIFLTFQIMILLGLGFSTLYFYYFGMNPFNLKDNSINYMTSGCNGYYGYCGLKTIIQNIFFIIISLGTTLLILSCIMYENARLPSLIIAAICAILAVRIYFHKPYHIKLNFLEININSLFNPNLNKVATVPKKSLNEEMQIEKTAKASIYSSINSNTTLIKNNDPKDEEMDLEMDGGLPHNNSSNNTSESIYSNDSIIRGNNQNKIPPHKSTNKPNNSIKTILTFYTFGFLLGFSRFYDRHALYPFNLSLVSVVIIHIAFSIIIGNSIAYTILNNNSKINKFLETAKSNEDIHRIIKHLIKAALILGTPFELMLFLSNAYVFEFTLIFGGIIFALILFSYLMDGINILEIQFQQDKIEKCSNYGNSNKVINTFNQKDKKMRKIFKFLSFSPFYLMMTAIIFNGWKVGVVGILPYTSANVEDPVQFTYEIQLLCSILLMAISGLKKIDARFIFRSVFS